ncbi:MAG TPA: NAD(P)-dependent oxidoreductase [Stellaceae bacterium]|nr:NAD(P)-dependent oxidoreductase [Stellaceae bacterium]
MHTVLRSLHSIPAISARLRSIPGVEVTVADSEAALAAALRSAELLLISDNLYSPEVARLVRESAPKLAWIQLLSAGYDAVAREGIPARLALTNAGDAYAPAVAAHAIALLLALQRQLPALLDAQARSHWQRGLHARNAVPHGSTIAVIGFGAIGSEIGRLLKQFGARIIAVTRSGRPCPDADESLPAPALRIVLPRADAVVLALAASPQTRHLIGAEELALMKSTAFLVNIARGYVVDGLALAEALRQGAIAGAALDVTEPEPLPPDHPLWTAPNLIITPHMAGAAGEVVGARLAVIVGNNVERHLRGEPLLYRVAL